MQTSGSPMQIDIGIVTGDFTIFFNIKVKFFTPGFKKLKGREKKGFRKLNSKNRLKYFKSYMNSSRLSKRSMRLKRNKSKLSQKLNRKISMLNMKSNGFKYFKYMRPNKLRLQLRNQVQLRESKQRNRRLFQHLCQFVPNLELERGAKRGRCPRSRVRSRNLQSQTLPHIRHHCCEVQKVRIQVVV